MAADVALVVDVDTNKATRGINTLKKGVDDLATKGVGKLNIAFQSMLGNLGAQATSFASRLAMDITRETFSAAIDLQRSSQQIAANIGITRTEAEKGVAGISAGGRDVSVVGSIAAKLSRGGGKFEDVIKTTDAIVSMGEAMGRTSPADLFALSEAYDTVMDRFKSSLEETSGAIGTMLTKGEMEPGDIAGFAETMRGRARTLNQVVSMVAGAADAGVGKQLKRMMVSEKGRDKAALRRFMESGAKGMTIQEIEQRRKDMLSLGGEKVARVIPGVTSALGVAVSRDIESANKWVEEKTKLKPGETAEDRSRRAISESDIEIRFANWVMGMLTKSSAGKNVESQMSRAMTAQEKTAAASKATAEAIAK